MKKDNFDLRAYLIENKMTENSRGEVRHHLGETKLDTRLFKTGHILLEGYDHHDPDSEYDPNAEADYADVLYGDRLGESVDSSWEQEFRDNMVDSGYPEDRIEQIIQLGREHPEWIPAITGEDEENMIADFDAFLEDPEAYMQSSATDRAMDLSRRKFAHDNDIEECGPELNLNAPIEEAGYTDDSEEYEDDGIRADQEEDDDWGDNGNLPYGDDEESAEDLPDAPAVPNNAPEIDDPEDERGTSLLDLVNRDRNLKEDDDFEDDDFDDEIPDDPRARRAAEKAMKADDPNHDYDIDTDFSSNEEPAEAPEKEVPLSKHNKWVTGDLSMDSLFGPDAANVEIFGDSDDDNENLKQLFRKHRNYRPAILKATVKQAMDYFREYEKPDSLYLIPAIDRGGYEMKRFNPGNRAVAIVYRPEELSGQNWVDQIEK